MIATGNTLRAGTAALLVALPLAACGNQGAGQTIGTLLGAAAGGAVGSQVGSGTGRIVAIGAGVLIGGLVGNQLGRHLDQQDRQLASGNAQRSLEGTRSGSTSKWKNPDTGHAGTFSPQPAYRNSRGQICREGTSIIIVEGKEEQVTSTYCRNPDGTWTAES